eukprot:s401_g10.t1
MCWLVVAGTVLFSVDPLYGDPVRAPSWTTLPAMSSISRAHEDLLLDFGQGPPWRQGDVLEDLQQEYIQACLRARDALERCVLFARKPEVMKLQDEEYMKCHDYSVLACPLDLPHGSPDAQGYLLWVYFEGRHLDRLRMALKTIGLNLDEGIIERVDSKTSSLFEQELFLSKEPMFRWDEAVHSPSEEIRFKDYSFYPWADTHSEEKKMVTMQLGGEGLGLVKVFYFSCFGPWSVWYSHQVGLTSSSRYSSFLTCLFAADLAQAQPSFNPWHLWVVAMEGTNTNAILSSLREVKAMVTAQSAQIGALTNSLSRLGEELSKNKKHQEAMTPTAEEPPVGWKEHQRAVAE